MTEELTREIIEIWNLELDPEQDKQWEEFRDRFIKEAANASIVSA